MLNVASRINLLYFFVNVNGEWETWGLNYVELWSIVHFISCMLVLNGWDFIFFYQFLLLIYLVFTQIRVSISNLFFEFFNISLIVCEYFLWINKNLGFFIVTPFIIDDDCFVCLTSIFGLNIGFISTSKTSQKLILSSECTMLCWDSGK